MSATRLSYQSPTAAPPPVHFVAEVRPPRSPAIQPRSLPPLPPALRELSLMLLAAIVTSATFVGLGVLCGVLGLL